jgi:hypothetical protein
MHGQQNIKFCVFLCSPLSIYPHFRDAAFFRNTKDTENVRCCNSCYCVSLNSLIHKSVTLLPNIQGDQKVSVHLIITIQKVSSNVHSVPPPVSRRLLTRQTVFSKTVFSIARSTFRMCSVMAIFNSSVLWGLFVRCTETF